jgi:hypothetical protein
MHPVISMIARPRVGITAQSVWACGPRWIRGCGAVAGAAQDTGQSDGSSSDNATASARTFACVGIDSDMNGAIVLVTCQRNDSLVRLGKGADQSMVRPPYFHMSVDWRILEK